MFRLATLAVALSFFPALAQAPLPDPRIVAGAIERKAQASREYAFEGQMSLAGHVAADELKEIARARLRMAVAPGGKFLLQVEPAGKGEYLLVSNGQKSWAYVPKLKQYTEEETGAVNRDISEDDDSAASALEDRDLSEVFAPAVVPVLARIYKTAEGIDFKGQAEVKFGKKKEQWPVLRALSKPGADGLRTLTQLVVDPATLAIGRLVFSASHQVNEQRVLVRVTVDFDSLQLGDAVPDSTFDFTPPKNAKLVDAVPIPGQTGSFLVNRPAPDFDLKTIDGRRTRLSDMRGKPVLLAFWASWCGPCRRELPALAKLHEEFASRGLQVLGVNDEGKAEARAFVEKAGLPFATLDDADQKAHSLYRVRSVPSAFLIDRDGRIVRFLRGAHEYADIKAALQAVGL